VTTTLPFSTSATATATNVGRLRRSLRHWLVEVLAADPDAVDDLTLATSEALENAADHAYVHTAVLGTMFLEARDHGDRITIVVSDNGHWQRPDAEAGYRGRGIDLMSRLADTSRVRPSAGGTSVTLVHRRTP
jgi:anti-sigma regulatory factor (Ser/Thr protein kinase)